MPLMHTPSPPPLRPSSSSTPPRAPNSESTTPPARAERLTIRDRRRRYLALHPDYVAGAGLETAEPLLYDAAVRRFLSADERRAKRPVKGIAAGMAAALVGAEARVASLEKAARGQNGLDVFGEGEGPRTKEEGWEVWRTRMERRFLDGGDGDFDYAAVDGNAEFDDVEEDTRRRQDEYFDGQQDEYFDGQQEEFVGGENLEGETGVQDF